MKTIDYQKSFGDFTIKYSDDDSLYTLSTQNSILDINLIRSVIDHDEGDIFTYQMVRGNHTTFVDVELVKKNITYVFEELDDNKYYKDYYDRHNEFVVIDILDRSPIIDSDNIYFLSYFKSSNSKISGTFEYSFLMNLEKYRNVEYYKTKKIKKTYNFLETYFTHFFLSNVSDYNVLCCVPPCESSTINNNPLAILIKKISLKTLWIDGSQLLIRKSTVLLPDVISFRSEDQHLNSITLNGDVRGKKIILIDSITTSGASLKACKKILLKAGAKDVLCFAFCRSC